MPLPSPLSASLAANPVAKLREALAQTHGISSCSLPFGIGLMDKRLATGGVDGAGLHEFAAASSSLNDDAAATLFLAGIAARFAANTGQTVCWAMTTFDLYAPGLEQVGLGPEKLLYAQGRKDVDVLAIAEDALRDGSLACVIAEVKTADMTATRRLQLAASDGQTPLLLYRRHRARERTRAGGSRTDRFRESWRDSSVNDPPRGVPVWRVPSTSAPPQARAAGADAPGRARHDGRTLRHEAVQDLP